MSRKTVVKLFFDIIMSVLLLLLMGYPFWGSEVHEWMGILIFVLFVMHHVLNVHWFTHWKKGQYSIYRIFVFLINIALLLIMVLQMYSGIVISRHVFDVSIGKAALGRRLHMVCAYWGFLLMGLHLGLHWKRIVGMLLGSMHRQKTSVQTQRFACFIGCFIAIYGIFAFYKRDLWRYLFLRNEFVFFNYEESKCLFYLDYLAVIALCVFVAHCLSRHWLNHKK